MLTIVQPIQPYETTEDFMKRVESDATQYAEARREFFRTEPCREKRKQVKDSMTGLALIKMGSVSESVCFECGKVEKHVPLKCPKCGCEDYMDVWYIEGEWYFTGEEYCLKAIKVRVTE